MSNPKTKPERGIATSTTEYLGIGHIDERRSYKSNITVYDESSGSQILEFSGLRYHAIDTREAGRSGHMFNRLLWKPVVAYLTQRGLKEVATQRTSYDLPVEANTESLIDIFIDLIAHKNPTLMVIEINIAPNYYNSLWLEGNYFDTSSRAACSLNHIASATPTGLLELQHKYSSFKATFGLLDLGKLPEDFTTSEESFDLAIIKLLSGPDVWLSRSYCKAFALA